MSALSRTLIITSLISFAVAAPVGEVVLEWDYPAQEVTTNLSFQVYGSTNINTPMTNWAVLASVPGTNKQARFVISPGRYFFVMTASNEWGKSDFSDVVSTSPLPRSDVNVRIVGVR